VGWQVPGQGLAGADLVTGLAAAVAPAALARLRKMVSQSRRLYSIGATPPILPQVVSTVCCSAAELATLTFANRRGLLGFRFFQVPAQPLT